MGEIADELIAEGLAQLLDYKVKIINPFWDTWLWKDSNEIVRHFEYMDSFHLMKIKDFLENQQGQKNRMQRIQRISHINHVLSRRDYTNDQYKFDKTGVNFGLRCDPYDEEELIDGNNNLIKIINEFDCVVLFGKIVQNTINDDCRFIHMKKIFAKHPSYMWVYKRKLIDEYVNQIVDKIRFEF